MFPLVDQLLQTLIKTNIIYKFHCGHYNCAVYKEILIVKKFTVLFPSLIKAMLQIIPQFRSRVLQQVRPKPDEEVWACRSRAGILGCCSCVGEPTAGAWSREQPSRGFLSITRRCPASLGPRLGWVWENRARRSTPTQHVWEKHGRFHGLPNPLL